MNIKARGAAACLSSLMILVSIAATSLAQTPTTSLKDQLVGHWQLVSVAINGSTPYGANPRGSMFIDAAGHYSVIVITGGTARNISYFGTYTINDADSTMTIHIDASSRADADGTNQTRTVSFSGNELIQSSQSPKSATPGDFIKVTWQRAN